MPTRRLAFVVFLLGAAASCRALLEADELALGVGSGGGSGDGDGDGDGSTSTSDGPGPGSTGAGSNASSSGAGGSPSSSASSSAETTSESASGSGGDGGTGGGGGEGPGCGNGTIEDEEDCDDDGTESGDGCSAACEYEGVSCAAPIEVVIGFGEAKIFRTTNAGGDTAVPGCGIAGAARFFEVTPQVTGFLTAWIRSEGTDYDSGLVGSTECGGNGLCSGLTPNGGEVVTAFVQADVPYYFAATGSTPADIGTFELQITLDAGTCSDPVDLTVEPGFIPVQGELSSSADPHSGTCGGAGRDVVFRLTGGVGVSGARADMLNHAFDAVLYADATCPEAGALIACSNEPGNGSFEQVTVSLATPAYIFVDSVDGDDAFTLDISSLD